MNDHVRVIYDPLQTAAIVGGGIGGLSAAIGLAQLGFQCTVFEQHDGETDVGAGIQLTPNATRGLFQLRLEMDISVIADTPIAMKWLDGTNDRELATFPIGDRALYQYGAPYFQVYRPELIKVLESACHDAPYIEVKKGIQVEHVAFEGKRARVETSDGSVVADLCVGADGANSTVRRFSRSASNRRKFAGFAFRATIPLRELDSRIAGNITRVWLHPKFHVVTYPVGRDRLLNCVFVAEGNETDDDADIHRQKATLEELHSCLAHASPLLRELVNRVNEADLYRWPLHQTSASPVRRSPSDRLVLIGDAWHSTLPFAAQGAALAIEDAVLLAWCVRNAHLTDMAPLISEFEQQRLPRIRSVQRISARNRAIYHLADRTMQNLRNAFAPIGYEWTARKLFAYQCL